MPPSLFRSKRNAQIETWLATALKRALPNLDFTSMDRRLLVFASRDLEICLSVKWNTQSLPEVRRMLIRAAETRPDELNAFLTVWISKWLAKWRERVTLIKKPPLFSLHHIKRIMKAKRTFQRMDQKDTLKRLVVQTLIRQGEVCRSELLAETLIVQEITRTLPRNHKTPTKLIPTDSMKILQNVQTRIRTLAKSKSPLIYLKFVSPNSDRRIAR